jgi:hypothetical protein
MQKFALSALLLGATIGAANAQIKQGTVLLGGSIGYASGKSESTYPGLASMPDLKTTGEGHSVIFNPQVGFFIVDNLAIGLNGLVSSGRSTSVQQNYVGTGTPITLTSKETANSWNLGPFVRYYHMIGEKVGLYGQLAGGYQHGTLKTENARPQADTRTTKTTGGYANLMPGAVYFLTPKIALELTMGNLGYEKTKSTSEFSDITQTNQKGSSSSFAANFGLRNLALGASFYLGN